MKAYAVSQREEGYCAYVGNSILAKGRFGALAQSPKINKDVKFPFSWNPGLHGSFNLPLCSNYSAKSECLEGCFFPQGKGKAVGHLFNL